MSLISEALKKAEKKRTEFKEEIKVPLPPEPPRSRKKITYSIVVLLLVIIISPIIIVLLLKVNSYENKPPNAKAKAVRRMEEPQTLKSSSVEQKKSRFNKRTEDISSSLAESSNVNKYIPGSSQNIPLVQAVPPPSHPKRPAFREGLKKPLTEPEQNIMNENKEEEAKEEKPKIVIKVEKEQEKNCGLLFQSNKLLEAEKCYLQQLKLGRTRDLLEAYGTVELMLKKWPEAERAFKEALGMGAASSILWFNYGISLFRQKKLDEAERAFSLALRLSPPVCEAHYYLGLCKDLKGEFEDALQQYKLSLGCALPQNLRSWTIQRIAILIKNKVH